MKNISLDCLPLSLFVGYERENDARGVTFDYSAWAEQYGNGVLQLLVQRPGDADPYPVVLTAGENNTAVWLLSATDTAVKGQLEVQLIFTVGSVVAKTAVLPVLVGRSLAAGATPPDPYETWLETLTELAEQILHTTQPPEIRNGYWYIFDPDTGEYVNSGVKAEGEDGVGITGAQLNADYTLTLSFSDGTSYTTPSIRGAQGEPGPTPQLSIGAVTTGAAGSSAAVEITGTPEAPVLNFTIPRGDTGEVSEAELQAALLDKADVITDTASGAIASFPDGAAAPVKALTVAVEPVQDLHGYDNPWPGGGGTNLLDPQGYTNGLVSLTIGDDINTITSSIRYTHSVPYDATDGLYLSAQSLDNNYVNWVTINLYDSDDLLVNKITHSMVGNTWYSDVIPANTYVKALVQLGAPGGGITVDPSVAKVILAKGTTPVDWTPYSNFCPISGWTEVDVYRTGKNLFSSNVTHGIWSAAGIYYSHEGNSSKYLTSEHKIPVCGGETYCLSFLDDTSNAVASISCNVYNGNSLISTLYINMSTKTISVPSEADSITINFTLTNAITNLADVSTTDFQLELGSATAYKPYVGTTYHIPLGQTVYGGTLDVTSGVLTVDRVIDTFTKDSAWYGFATGTGNSSAVVQLTEYQNCRFISGIQSKNGAISSTGKEAPNYWTSGRPNELDANYGDMCFAYSSTGQLRFHRSDVANITDLASFKANFPDTQIVYFLDTPFEIPLTPEEIETLKGTNNFWSDAGDVSVEYRADTKLYIEKKITAAIAAALNS